MGAALLEGSLVGPAADGMTHPPTELREGTEAGAALHSPCRHLAGSCGWAGGAPPERAAGVSAPVEDCSRLGVAADDCPALCVRVWLS